VEPLFDLAGRTVAFGGSLPTDAVIDALLRMNACPKNWRTPITIYLGVGSERRHGIRALEAIQTCSLIRSLRSPVHTVGLGLLPEFEALVLAAGQPGQRHLLPHALISLGGLDVDDITHLPNGSVGLGHHYREPSLREQAKSLIKIQIQQLTKELGLPRNLWSRPRMITATQAIKLGMADALVPIPTPQLILNFEKSPDHEIIHTPNEP